MYSTRATTLLQGVTDVRHWVVSNIPMTASMVGYDLFLWVGHHYLSSQPLDLPALYAALPYPQKEVREAIAQMERAALMAQAPRQNGSGRQLVPTAKFLDLLDRFHVKFESLFIPRKPLRDEQMRVALDDPKLQAFAELLYDRFHDLGWLYLHNFGAICFLMASLVKRAAIAEGHRAHIESCYVSVCSGANRFCLGGEGTAKPGQIDGHAVCVIDEAMVVDFGLGNMRRFYRRDFPWALAFAWQPKEHLLGGVVFSDGEVASWCNDWQSSSTAAELARYEEPVEHLFKQYQQAFHHKLVH